jgi:hypothetical protein
MNEIVVRLFLFLHFVGLAALLGGLLAQLGESFRTVTPAIIYGALAQLVTGIVLAGAVLAEINYVKIGLKLGIMLVILLVVVLRREKPLAMLHYYGLIGLSVANVGIAVFW